MFLDHFLTSFIKLIMRGGDHDHYMVVPSGQHHCNNNDVCCEPTKNFLRIPIYRAVMRIFFTFSFADFSTCHHYYNRPAEKSYLSCCLLPNKPPFVPDYHKTASCCCYCVAGKYCGQLAIIFHLLFLQFM